MAKGNAIDSAPPLGSGQALSDIRESWSLPSLLPNLKRTRRGDLFLDPGGRRDHQGEATADQAVMAKRETRCVDLLARSLFWQKRGGDV